MIDENVDAEFWGGECDEHINSDDRSDTIFCILDDMKELPGEIKIHGWRRMRVADKYKKTLAERIIEDTVDCLECDYGYGGDEPMNGYNDFDQITKEYIDKFIEIYTPWSCEIVVTETINCREWIKDNGHESHFKELLK